MQNSTKLIDGAKAQVKLTEKDIARFYSKVGPVGADGCRLWLAGKSKSGYGYLRVGGKNMRSNRLAWIAVNGCIPKGMCVCHSCDVPACCQIEHLWLGTIADDMRDKVSKSRQSKGEPHSAIMKIVSPRGDAHHARAHPERLSRGKRHSDIMRRVASRGEAHFSRTCPERLARGDRNGRHTMPEKTARGAAVGSSKLTEAIVLAVRSCYNIGGTSYRKLACKFGVSKAQIRRIICRESWAHVV